MDEKLNRHISWSQVFLVFVVAVVLSLMVVPLKPLVLDGFLIANLSFSLTILMATLFITHNMGLSTMPTLILMCTLLRLGLNISSTRLILAHGEAGTVIRTFGDFVAQGNIAVGLVVFLVLMIMQYFVVAKGAERVAEVSARFSLDALPGKQMGVDADLRAGMISGEQAASRRFELIRESRLYGAMDGAMKFVKGDTLAGFVIVLINIVGGLIVGCLQRGMPVKQAFLKYAILTIGDGLVSQIPAFLVALSAGFLITRVESDRQAASLSEDIGRQLGGQPLALVAVAVILVVIGFLPGFPKALFFVAAVSLFTVSGVLLLRAKRRQQGLQSVASCVSQRGRLGLVTPLALELSPELYGHFTHGERWQHCFRALLPQVIERLKEDSGVPIPEVKIAINESLSQNRYRIAVHAIPVDEGFLSPDHGLVKSAEIDKEAHGQFILQSCETVHGTAVHLLDLKRANELKAKGVSFLNPEDVLLRHLVKVIRRHAADFLGIQEVKVILDAVEEKHPDLVKEVIPRLMTIQKFTDVLRRLVEEGIPIKDFRELLHIMASARPDTRDAIALTEFVRMELRRLVSFLYADVDSSLSCFSLDPEFEDLLAQHIDKNDEGEFVTLSPSESEKFVAGVKNTYLMHGLKYRDAVILTTPECRRFVRRLLKDSLHDVAVLSYHELEPWVRLEQRDTISQYSDFEEYFNTLPA